MYKKLYKDAVNSIPVNEELKEKLMAKTVSEKRKKPTYLYRYGALAACLIIAVGVIGVFSKPQVLSEKPEKIVETENIPMNKMSRGLPVPVSEEVGSAPPAYSPTEGLDFSDWILPDGLEFTESSENSVAFSNGDMKITVTLLPCRGFLDTSGEREVERIDE